MSVCLIVAIPGDSTFEDGGGMNNISEFLTFYNNRLGEKELKKLRAFFGVTMALFLSADFHQGDERFSDHSGGKQCAFMTLSALLTARNIPISSYKETY